MDAHDALPLMDALPLPMSGMLVKKGRRRKNWKVRFFYMLGSHLQYFEYENSGKPLGQGGMTRRLYAATRDDDATKPFMAHFLRLARTEPVKLQRA